MRGFLREAVALGAWVIALFLAWHFSDLIAPHLGGLMSGSDGAAVGGARHHRGAGAAARRGHRRNARALRAPVDLQRHGPAARFRLRHCCAASCCSGCSSFSGSCCVCRTRHWWRHSMLIPYGESIANGLRVLVGEERVRAQRRTRTCRPEEGADSHVRHCRHRRYQRRQSAALRCAHGAAAPRPGCRRHRHLRAMASCACARAAAWCATCSSSTTCSS